MDVEQALGANIFGAKECGYWPGFSEGYSGQEMRDSTCETKFQAALMHACNAKMAMVLTHGNGSIDTTEKIYSGMHIVQEYQNNFKVGCSNTSFPYNFLCFNLADRVVLRAS